MVSLKGKDKDGKTVTLNLKIHENGFVERKVCRGIVGREI